MNILHERQFVIEAYLPMNSGEDATVQTIEGDMKVKEVKYAWNWFCGMSVAPGTGGYHKGGKYIPPVAVDVWSPYFEDAEIFTDRDQAVECWRNVLGSDISFKVVNVLKESHYLHTWKVKK